MSNSVTTVQEYALKIVFLGKYNQSEILTGPEKVAKRIFHESVKSYDNSLFIEFYFKKERKSNLWLRLFGKEVVGERVLRFGHIRLFFFLVSQQPDIIHIVTFERFILFVFFYKILLKARIVSTLHGVIRYEYNLSLNKKSLWGKAKDYLLEYFMTTFSDKLIFVSELQYSIAYSYYKMREYNCQIIPNGIDGIFYKSKSKASISDNLNIVIRNRSGFDIDEVKTLVKILSECDTLKLRLFILTDKKNKIDDERYLQDQGTQIYINVVTTMSTELLSRFLEDKHFFINAARYDTFSLFTVECMAAGVVPIVADSVGMKSYIKDGDNGFVYDNRRPELIKEIIQGINSGKYDFQKLSTNASKIYNELQWENIARSYYDLYKACLH